MSNENRPTTPLRASCVGGGSDRRQTTALADGPVRAAVERTALHDEVQDFEGQIRRLAGGTGLMNDADFAAGTRWQPMGTPKACVSADLDALAA